MITMVRMALTNSCIASSRLHLGKKMVLENNSLYQQMGIVCIPPSKTETRRRPGNVDIQVINKEAM